MNFHKKLEEIDEDQLKTGVNEHTPQFGVLESNELIKRSINRLEKTIDTFSGQSSKQTEKMIRLTWYVVGLTVVMVAGLTIQILNAFGIIR
ncbi:MAG: hypothetical protein NTU76_00395 [Candidatus Taylorbacteria bacterium]|nr:hypothetical protein [Candidatus Taylorbacteria bacterium]